jgi:hypothetical protein
MKKKKGGTTGSQLREMQRGPKGGDLNKQLLHTPLPDITVRSLAVLL